MNKERAKELLPIITAFAEGKEIQSQNLAGEWMDATYPVFYDDRDYRIKPPQPKEYWLVFIRDLDDPYLFTSEAAATSYCNNDTRASRIEHVRAVG